MGAKNKNTKKPKEENTDALIKKIGFDEYGKKYKYLQKTFQSSSYNDDKAIEKIDEGINQILRSGKWKIDKITWITSGTSNYYYVCSVLFEYKKSDTRVIV